ncbi:MAG: hypothetical protein P8Y64_04165 [Gammaproteobacteria bacterium]|jgi:tetratricopeptide (TPR) repeat protein
MAENHDKDFEEGRKFFEFGNFEVAEDFFSELVEEVAPGDPRWALYRSWLGLTRAMQNDRGGLVLCRLAVKEGGTGPELHHNLARAERKFGNVSKALRVIEEGLSAYPDDPPLLDLLQRYDRRRPLSISWLRRDHPLNRWLGVVSFRWHRYQRKKRQVE